MKKLTLDKAWELCLKQWKWLIKELKKKKAYNICDVWDLKEEWIEKNKLTDMQTDCVFCEYNSQKRNDPDCLKCPAKRIEKTLDDYWCEEDKWHYGDNPLAFYKKLLQLNKKRLENK